MSATADDVRRVALAALATALENSREEARKKPGLTGVRAVATGAVIYTAGRAVYTGRRLLREHLASDGDKPEGSESRQNGEDREEPDEDDEHDDRPSRPSRSRAPAARGWRTRRHPWPQTTTNAGVTTS
jgi:hypothetical protein